jgi:exopolysaccharide biosynthesis polyprenyl glycosylphosphotransferase
VATTFPKHGQFDHPILPMPHLADCARLIPGDDLVRQSRGRKPLRSVGRLSQERVAEFSSVSAGVTQNPLALLIPSWLRNRGAWRWIRLAATDFVLVALNWLILGALMLPLRVPFPHIRLFEFAVGAPAVLMGIALLHAALIILIGDIDGLYALDNGLQQQGNILARSILWATVLLGLCYSLQGASRATSALLGCAALLDLGSLWAWRWQSQKMQSLGRDQRNNVRNVLIVGAEETGRRIASFLDASPADRRSVYGFLDNDRPLGDGVIGRVSDLGRLARTGFVDEVILAAPHNRKVAMQVLEEARNLRLDVKMIPDLFGCRLRAKEVGVNEFERVGELPLISLHAERLPATELLFKRVLDVVVSGFILSMLAPLMAVIACLIKLDSPGKVLYRARRAGRKGKLFRCYKFRTMVSNADALKDRLRQSNNERSGPVFKIADDPRITRLGRFLRKYSLDELPQLWNVLTGDMSLVGPRPHTADDYAAYQVEHLARLDVTPGITGLWQVTARKDPSFHRGMELDREYIRTWSLTADIRILAKTVIAVVSGSGQ